MNKTLDEFLLTQNISNEMWTESQGDWELLKKIAEDHDQRSESLRATASYFASAFQSIPGVHSVRWRIKDSDHLLAKIIRKKFEKSEKYASITYENYHTIIADLIGVRVLHLFKHDYEEIDKSIREQWELNEVPIHYIREGDTIPNDFKKELFEEKPHPAGYRSIHYVLKTLPTIRLCLAEVQVRTIFEEGWSEIDHKLKYPNFPDSPLVTYFLTIFNRMAGSADEMGTFVNELAAALEISAIQTAKLTNDHNETLKRMNQLLSELDKKQNMDEKHKATIRELQEKIQDLQSSTSEERPTSDQPSSGLNELLWGKNLDLAASLEVLKRQSLTSTHNSTSHLLEALRSYGQSHPTDLVDRFRGVGYKSISKTPTNMTNKTGKKEKDKNGESE